MCKEMKVLVVDDQPGVRQLLGTIIKESGEKVGEAKNGKEAVDIASNWKPNLVLMDIRMPVMGGVEALEKMKQFIPEIPVVMMTAYGSEESFEEMQKKGAAMCLVKPFDVDVVKKILADLQKNKTVKNEEKAC